MNNFKVRAQSAPWNKGVEFLAECDGAFVRLLIMDCPANKREIKCICY